MKKASQTTVDTSLGVLSMTSNLPEIVISPVTKVQTAVRRDTGAAVAPPWSCAMLVGAGSSPTLERSKRQIKGEKRYPHPSTSDRESLQIIGTEPRSWVKGEKKGACACPWRSVDVILSL